ncbi:MAG TPA: FtsX-like permease family protein [Allosphingosinicella sp.]|nr:FtsX-like permease family protein [Allosphingosinicella sp.]
MFTAGIGAVQRYLLRHPGHALLDIGGLAIGLAVFIVLALYVKYETSYESWFDSADEVYIVRDTWTLPGTPPNTTPITMGGLLDQLRGDYSGLVGTRIWPANAAVNIGGQVASEPVALADASFFKTFDWPLVAGDPATALQAPGSVVVSETIARKYFGTASALGRTLNMGVGDRTGAYRVTGVMRDIPGNSMFHPTASSSASISMLLPMTYDPAIQPNWYSWSTEQLWTFLRFPDDSAAKSFEKGLPAFIDRHAPSSAGKPMSGILKQSLLPLRDFHLVEPADRITVMTLGIVGLLTLLIATINYVNLATARAALRAREVAIRKVVGATQIQLILRFIGEAIATVALAALVGLTLAELALPFVNSLGGTDLAIAYFGWDGILFPLLLLILVVGTLAGIYPALILSSYQPASVLASDRNPAGGRSGVLLRETLVTLQFAVAIAFAIGTAVLLAQANHVREADLGFRRDGLILIPSFKSSSLDPSQRSTILNSFRSIPGVTLATQSDSAPGDSSTTSAMNIPRPDGLKPDPILTLTDIGSDYFETYGARLLAGRTLGTVFGSDDSINEGVTTGAVINRTAAASLGFESPAAALGKTVLAGDQRTIVGVVDDIRFRSPHYPVPPMMYLFRSRDLVNPIAAVRFEGADPRSVIARLRLAWRTIAPNVPFAAVTAEANLAEAYWRSDEQRSRLFALGAGLAVLIGCVGLYGLASFSAARRMREIGIRKALGATTADIAGLLLGQFLRPVLIANLIAWPIAFFAMRTWLSRFDDRVSLGVEYFLAATFLAVSVAAVTVLAQTVRAARAEPARALRYE